jgi:hypothetical protein
MPAQTVEVVAGWTADIDFDLKSMGTIPTGTMAGMSVTLVLTDRDTGVAIPTTGDCSIVDATNWIVRYTPDSTDLIAGTYHGRFKVTDASTKVAYFPSGEPDIWLVRSET